MAGEPVRLNHYGNGVRMALVGLFVVAAISVAAGSGRKPAVEQGTTVSLRQLSGGEVMDILHKFPEMMPSDMADQKNDTSYLVRVFGFAEVTVPLLERTFPAARFYMGRDFDRKPSGSYLMVIAGDRRYVMPGGFNQLLLGNGLKVTDKNTVDLAKSFVLLAVGNEPTVDRSRTWGHPGRLDTFAPVTVLDAKRIEQVISGISYDAWLKVKIGDQAEEWYFDTKYGQFGVVSRGNVKGLIKQYNPVEGKPREERGQLVDTSSIVVDADTNDAHASGTRLAEEVKVAMRRLPTSEVMTILDKFPEMVSTEPASLKVSEVHARLYPLSEVTAAPLKRVFPNVRFFKGLDTGILPPVPYVMAITDRKRYPMPAGLNQLLSDSDVKVTDANLAEIAKAVVILALGNDRLGNPSDGGYVSDELLAFPKITSLSAEMQVTGDSHAAKLTVRIGDSEESWYVPRWHDQLGWVSRGNANGLIKDYQIPEAQPREQQK